MNCNNLRIGRRHPDCSHTAYLQHQLIEERAEKEWSEGIQEAPVMKLADIEIALSKNQKNLIKAERRPHFLSITNEFTGPILVEVPPLNNNFTYYSYVEFDNRCLIQRNAS